MKRLIFLILALLVAGSAMAAQTVQVMTNGTIDLDKLPTLDFSYETDPSNPVDGQIWWNETTKQLKVADSAGIYEFNATALVAWDTTPTAFSFTDVVNATTNSTYTSAPITVAGINHPAAISVSGDASAKYSVNNATATAANGTVASGDSVRAVVTSSASSSTAVNATVTIGGVSDAYSVTTASVVSYLVNEDFEGTGTPSGWTAAGTGRDYDSTDSPLSGAQSLVLSAASAAPAAFDNMPIFTMDFLFRADAIATTGNIIRLIVDGVSSSACVSLQNTGRFQLFTPGINKYGTEGDIVAATDYEVQLVMSSGSGANGVASLKWRKVGATEWVSISGNTGTFQTGVTGITFRSENANTPTVWDNIQVYE